jgi:hypothetical protein
MSRSAECYAAFETKELGPLNDMKQRKFSAPVLLLAICTLLIGAANQSVNAQDKKSSNRSGAIFATSAANGGRLLIQRSPVLGDNVSIAFKIDGQLAGTLVRDHTYDRYITPGRHVLTASDSTSASGWRATLDVRPGQTYSYVASYNVNKLVLTPTGSR